MSPVRRLLSWLLQPLVLSFGMLAAAWFLAPYAQRIPPSSIGIWQYGPWVTLGILAVMAMAYRLGRALIVALLLAIGVLLIERAELLQAADQHYLRALIITVFVPVNLVLAAWYKERGIFTDFGIIRVSVMLAQLGALCWAWYASPTLFNKVVGALEIPWVAQHLPHLAWPQPGLAVMVAGGVALVVLAVIQRAHFNYGLVAAYVGFAVSAWLHGPVETRHALLIAIGLILCIAILRDAYNMAYRDELTGLPGRRALTELCLSLSGDYTLAMMDVDHFKKFNDTYGHDTGDDVLKVVASHIARVRDGGKAFRYGGEEFTIVYPSKVKEQAVRSLEAVRESIADYELVVRPPRQKVGTDEAGKANRGKGKTTTNKRVSVTISIGVADRQERSDTPDDVLKRADQALYQAKNGGRNRVEMWADKPAGKRKAG